MEMKKAFLIITIEKAFGRNMLRLISNKKQCCDANTAAGDSFSDLLNSLSANAPFKLF
jgi:hypothetical protein